MKENEYNSKLEGEKSKYKVICSCSCRVSFYPFENRTKKTCKWCGKTVYINKNEEFKDLYLKEKRRIDNEDR